MPTPKRHTETPNSQSDSSENKFIRGNMQLESLRPERVMLRTNEKFSPLGVKADNGFGLTCIGVQNLPFLAVTCNVLLSLVRKSRRLDA